MSNTVKVVKASIGSYKDKMGNTKHRYRTIGSVIKTKNGEMLIIDAIPLNWDGVAWLNDPPVNEYSEQQKKPTYEGLPADDDLDTPF